MLTIESLAPEAESANNATLPALYLLVCEGDILCHPERRMAWFDEASVANLTLDTRLHVGVINGSHMAYALPLTTKPEPGTDLHRALSHLEWMPPRALFRHLQGMDFDAMSRALQLSHWFNEHRFCSQCGKPLTRHPTEPAMYCEPCNKLYYPRISPCIIVLITHGEYCLLAHHVRYAQSFYSTLAGFVEAGESLEQALHREVMEEVGLTVDSLEYFGSQSWPFPGQMMVGYIARYHSGDIKIDETEISDARWFHYTDLPNTPAEVSISGQLIAEFVTRCQQATQ